VIVRAAREADAAAIRQIVVAAFGRDDEAVIVDAVRAAGEALIELVAEIDDDLVGHVLFNCMRCRPSMLAAGLGPLAVTPSAQGRGVGAALASVGLESCRVQGAVACFVLGAPAYYGRFGFISAQGSVASPFAHSAAFQILTFNDQVARTLEAVDYPTAFG
jgi:predicted N-acetyltransferase YhbS